MVVWTSRVEFWIWWIREFVQCLFELQWGNLLCGDCMSWYFLFYWRDLCTVDRTHICMWDLTDMIGVWGSIVVSVFVLLTMDVHYIYIYIYIYLYDGYTFAIQMIFWFDVQYIYTHRRTFRRIKNLQYG